MEFTNTADISRPKLLKMACPTCRKLYSVEAHALEWRDGARLHFECVNPECLSPFEAQSPTSMSSIVLETFEIARPTERSSERPSVRSSRSVAEPAPLRADLLSATRRCPKCGIGKSMNATDCGNCGVVFAKYKPVEESAAGEIRCENRRDIHEMWESILTRYEDSALHERFVATCKDAGVLAYAAQKYSQILSASPTEEIARRMRSRILGFATYAAEPRRPARLPLFKASPIISLILFMSGAVITTGLMLPNQKSLVSIGLAAITICIGLRYLLRPVSGR